MTRFRAALVSTFVLSVPASAASSLCWAALVASGARIEVVHGGPMTLSRRWSGAESGRPTMLLPVPTVGLALPGRLILGTLEEEEGIVSSPRLQVAMGPVHYRVERGWGLPRPDVESPDQDDRIERVRWIPPEGEGRLPLLGFAAFRLVSDATEATRRFAVDFAVVTVDRLPELDESALEATLRTLFGGSTWVDERKVRRRWRL